MLFGCIIGRWIGHDGASYNLECSQWKSESNCFLNKTTGNTTCYDHSDCLMYFGPNYDPSEGDRLGTVLGILEGVFMGLRLLIQSFLFRYIFVYGNVFTRLIYATLTAAIEIGVGALYSLYVYNGEWDVSLDVSKNEVIYYGITISIVVAVFNGGIQIITSKNLEVMTMILIMSFAANINFGVYAAEVFSHKKFATTIGIMSGLARIVVMGMAVYEGLLLFAKYKGLNVKAGQVKINAKKY